MKIVDDNRQMWETSQHSRSCGCSLCEEKPQLQSRGGREDNGSPIVAHMGKLEPSVFVVPVPFVGGLVFEALSIEIEYLQ